METFSSVGDNLGNRRLGADVLHNKGYEQLSGHGFGGTLWRILRLRFRSCQRFATVRVALSSQSRSCDSPAISAAQKNLWPLEAGRPNGFSNPALINTEISWGKNPRISAA
jgi:hypothetical protein